jgi:hypothetical protein
LLGAILGKKVEKDRIPKIQSALQAGKFLVVVNGSQQELETARRVMSENDGQDVNTYSAA